MQINNLAQLVCVQSVSLRPFNTSSSTIAERATGDYLRTGTNVYQCRVRVRVRVPKDLAHFYPGKEWANRRTLKTSNLAQANRLAAQLTQTG